jgi:hypothetical protein
MVPVAVIVTDAPNLFHLNRAVDRLVELIPLAVRLDEGFPKRSALTSSVYWTSSLP